MKIINTRILRVEWGGYYDRPYFAKFRGANFMRWQIWWVCVEHWMPMGWWIKK